MLFSSKHLVDFSPYLLHRFTASLGSASYGPTSIFNKQLFGSLKIRRCMVSWMKCWARKSPTYVKNRGNIRGGNSLVLAGKKILGFSVWRAHSLSDQHSVMSMKSGSTRYAVVAGPDGRMWLEHQAPGTAEALTSKPTFAG